jgi:hypothetical protein
MEIISASVGISFGLCLAALAVTPTMIGVYLELRAQKRHGAQQNASEFPAAYPPPVPFNYPQIFLREMPRETDRTSQNVTVRNRMHPSYYRCTRLPYLSIHKYFGEVCAV